MNRIVFIDAEISVEDKKVRDLGAVKTDGSYYHSSGKRDFIHFIQDSDFVCGHNIIKHDSQYLSQELSQAGFSEKDLIDTLPLYALLDPLKPSHSLSKDEKIYESSLNNPCLDARKAKELFERLVQKFKMQDRKLQSFLIKLLRNTTELKAFFRWLAIPAGDKADLPELITSYFEGRICSQADIENMIISNPVSLAYALVLINEENKYLNTPPWVLHSYPDVERIMFLLRSNPCITGCPYCDEAMDIHSALKKHFGWDSFRTFEGEPLQEKAVQAAVDRKSFLVVLPTGGGKSMTFQLPALIGKEATNSLTVVISPLQSLMKDQVDNLEKKGIVCSATINGSLDPIDRKKALERTESGDVNILYISPESLRSVTIEKLLLNRRIERFVIDEAHCFSAWGQDFRVDYLYIGEFIKNLQEKKQLIDPIPVSCFTATAKRQVIADIKSYLDARLNLTLEEVIAKSNSRPNLKFKILRKEMDEEKYQVLRNIIEGSMEPTIVYVSRTKKARELAERLSNDGYRAKPYHGKMDSNEKTENQDAFINGQLDLIIATSAFGMGVDKEDVRRVIHYDISSSLEDYIQEAGRAGRDQKDSDCVILYSDNDLDKHFVLLNQTKLNLNEVKQIWKSIKDFSKEYNRNNFSQSALEIARNAGWDENIMELETRVKTAIAALEESGYLKRKQNSTRIFASSIVPKTAMEGIERIQSSTKINEKDKEKARRILVKLISKRSRSNLEGEEAESRVDYIADQLGMHREEVIRIVNFLREENILEDYEDLTAYIKLSEKKRLERGLAKFIELEHLILKFIKDEATTIDTKQINEEAKSIEIDKTTPQDVITILNYWAIVGWIDKKRKGYSKNHYLVEPKIAVSDLEDRINKLHRVARFALEHVYKLAAEKEGDQEKVLINFSSKNITDAFNNSPDMFEEEIHIQDCDETLLYLTRIGVLNIEGGFMVLYQKMSIERVEMDNKIQYKKEDFKKLNEYYRNKAEQIHIVGEYAEKMLHDNKSAMTFVDDYFRENYDSFINRYFPGSRKDEIRKPISPSKFKQLFGDLSPRQLSIINDKDSPVIVVAAGPGSGKTRLLVHKLASLVYMEEVKFEQLLMLTFSRAAVSEFKTRLISLVGNGANYIDIKTFHSFCFDLIGERGATAKFDEVLTQALSAIRNNEVERSKITKSVLVIDEAQDMKLEEYELVKELMKANDGMRLIAVGDDDQNIYEFRGSSSKYLYELLRLKEAKKYELLKNYRSKQNLVSFTNEFLKLLKNRLKTHEIVANDNDNGKILLYRSNSHNLYIPLVEQIKNEGIRGSTCILTRTNEESSQVASILTRGGYRTKLILKDQQIKLGVICLIRNFLETMQQENSGKIIIDETWKKVKRDFFLEYHQSDKLDLLKRVIKIFEKTYPKTKYLTDLELFINESHEEDFYDADSDYIYVSTIHKSKGKEFDNVFILLEDYKINSEEDKRVLYVGMTRAKNNLSIYTNTGHLNHILVYGMSIEDSNENFSAPAQRSIHLMHSNVRLGYFIPRQSEITQLFSGQRLYLDEDYTLRNEEKKGVCQFSSAFQKEFDAILDDGFELKEAEVNYILYWYNKDHDKEYKIVLPELWFESGDCNRHS